MNTFFDVDAILGAAGASPSIPKAEEVARKIFNDGLVRTRALELATESFIVEALNRFTLPERNALKKRTGIIQPEPPKIQWAVILAGQEGNTTTYISMRAGNQTAMFNGSLEGASKLSFGGEKIPADILYEYSLHVPRQQ